MDKRSEWGEHDQCGDMAESMNLHAHSHGHVSVASNSCEAEVTAVSDNIKRDFFCVNVCCFGTLWNWSQSAQWCNTRIFPSTRCLTYEAIRFENLVASSLDCCGKCEIEQDTEDTKFCWYVDEYTRSGEAGGITWQGVVVTKHYKPVPIKMEPKQDTVSGERWSSGERVMDEKNVLRSIGIGARCDTFWRDSVRVKWQVFMTEKLTVAWVSGGTRVSWPMKLRDRSSCLFLRHVWICVVGHAS